MPFETISLQKIRVMRHEGTEGQHTAWHTSFSIGIDRAHEIGIAPKNHYNSPFGSAILKDGTAFYLCTNSSGTAEVGEKKFIMLEDIKDTLVIDGLIYVRCYDEFSIDPLDPRDEKRDVYGASEPAEPTAKEVSTDPTEEDDNKSSQPK